MKDLDELVHYLPGLEKLSLSLCGRHGGGESSVFIAEGKVSMQDLLSNFKFTSFSLQSLRERLLLYKK